MPTRDLTIEGPFDLRATLRTTGAGRFRDGAWWWPVWGEPGPSTIAIAAGADGVMAEAWGPDADGLLERLGSLVGVASAARVRFPGTPADPFLARSEGLRLGASGDVHGALVAAILGQVVTTTEASASLRSLRSRFGAPAPGPRSDLVALPPPGILAGLGYEELHRCGIERRRAEVLIEAARRWSRVAPIIDLAPAEARSRLEAIRGIGPWSSAHVVGAAMGAADEIAVGDYHLPHQISWALAREERGTDARMLELLEPYRPLRRHVLVAVVQSGLHAPRFGPRTAVRRHL